MNNKWAQHMREGLDWYNRGNFNEAIKHLEEATSEAGKFFGEVHPNYALCLHNLGEVYTVKGEYSQAEPLLHKALQIKEKAFGKEHQEYAASLNSLARLYKVLGAYDQAEPLLEQALDIIKGSTMGTKHPYFFLALNNLAAIYYSLGKYEKAEPLHHQALNIIQRAHGKEHPEYARNLYNLGMLYKETRKYEDAEVMLHQSLNIRKKMLRIKPLDYAYSANGLAELYNELGEYEKAEPLLHQALEIRERILGKKHQEYDISLNNLAFLFEKKNEYQKALVLYHQSLEIRQEVLGNVHSACAKSLDNLAIVYFSIKEYDKAESLLKEALSIREEIFEPEHSDYVTNLFNLANLYKLTKENEKATRLYRKILKLREKVLGRDDPEYAASLAKIAESHREMEEYDIAESFYLEALNLQKPMIGKSNDYPIILNNLAVLYNDMGKYNEAVSLSSQALEILEKVTGKNHPIYSNSLNTLTLAYRLQGEYAKAESLIRQNLAIIESVSGKENSNYIQGLNNLAGLHKAMREYDEAESLFHQALEIRGKVYGKDHPFYATGLNNLASLYSSKKHYDKAEPLLKQALDIRRETQGKDHPDFAVHLNNLAWLYITRQRYDEAESLLHEALESQESIFGTDHPRHADTLHDLAWLYFQAEKYKQAESLYRQVVEIRGNVLGKLHPRYAQSLSHLAWLEIAIGKPKEALSKMLEAIEIERRMILHVSSMSDEKRLEKYIQSFSMSYFSLLSNFAQHYSELKEFTPLILDVVLKHKGLIKEIFAIHRDTILSSRNPELKGTFDELRKSRRALSSLIHQGTNEILPKQYRRRIHRLEQQIENLEKEISAQIPQVELRKKLENVHHSKIREILPKDTCLVEFVHIKHIDFMKLERPSLNWQKGSINGYLAFLLSGDSKKSIQIVKFDAREVDFLIGCYRSGIIKDGQRNIKIVPRQEKKWEPKEIYDGSLLYKKLFQPILDKIGDTKKLIISPDASLSLLPFEVLLQPDGRYVIEDFEISYIRSGRDILRFQYYDKPQSPPLILADPDYDLGLDDLTIENSFKTQLLKKSRSLTGSNNLYHFSRLKGAKAEGESIKKLLMPATELWMGKQVLDGKVKQIQSPEILHIATHGYYKPYFDGDEEEYSIKMSKLLGMDEPGMEPIFKQFFNNHMISMGLEKKENPLLSSGLALAGANTFLQKGIFSEAVEDGLLTALDVTGMDLIGTDLVVLSACDTGIGEIKAGEDVYGLPRAFMLAGARTLICSLWVVDDQETKILMINLYQKILQGVGKAQALREAQLEIIQTRRKAGKSDSPYYWGAFICIGNPEFKKKRKFNSFWKRLLKIN